MVMEDSLVNLAVREPVGPEEVFLPMVGPVVQMEERPVLHLLMVELRLLHVLPSHPVQLPSGVLEAEEPVPGVFAVPLAEAEDTVAALLVLMITPAVEEDLLMQEPIKIT
jgi:hypothetical protein